MIYDAEGYLSYELTETFPPVVTAEIEGVFSHGIYLETPSHGLLMIHGSEYGSIPFGIALDDCEAVIRRSGISEYHRVTISGDSLSILRDGSGLRLSLVPRRKKETAAGKPLDGTAFVRIAGEKLRGTDRGVLKSLAGPDFAETKYSAAAKSIIGSRKIEDALFDITGLGPGLTPSGDDFVAGWLYMGIHRLDRAGELRPVTERLQRSMHERTCRISCAYLDAVIRGGSFTLFDDVCFAESADELDSAADRLLAVGSNSGADLLSGMVCAACPDIGKEREL
ncbi:MAG: DUF2877 domain-containing protein [Lachnospiraceae bacterium]|nr:DUF2877 domain-containing protein [Lachnospiraceae bacterium]